MINSLKFLHIYKKIYKENSKIYNFKSTATILFLFSKISNFISPIFVIFQVDPNKITYFNFILSLILVLLIFLGNENFVQLGVLLYFICIVIDFCDGSVARYNKITSYYGKFIDGLVDVFLKTFLILSISFYGFQVLQNLNLLILGCISAVLSAFDTFILDRYSAIVRWYNSEYKKKVTPYIRKNFIPRLTFLYSDFFIILIGCIILIKEDENLLFYNLLCLNLLVILSSIQSVFIHSLFIKKFKILKKSKKKVRFSLYK